MAEGTRRGFLVGDSRRKRTTASVWLCDKDIDFDGDLEAQGCWRCEDMAFPDGGR
jgi:hypothetical protein